MITFVRESLGISSRVYLESNATSYDIITKPEGLRELVTSLDIKIDNALMNYFDRVNINVYSEEHFDDSVFKSSTIAIIDPLDGSSNFRNGISNYGTIIGIVNDSKLVCGGICSHSSGISLWSNNGRLRASRAYKHAENPHKSAAAILAYGTSTSKNSNNLLKSLFTINPVYFPGFHRIGSTCSAAHWFLAGNYSSFMALDVKLWDIAGIIPLFECEKSLSVYIFYNHNLITVLCLKQGVIYNDRIISLFKKSGIKLLNYDSQNFMNYYTEQCKENK